MADWRRYRITHRTSYQYGLPMTDGYTVACLVPRPTTWQRVVDSDVSLDPPASEWDSFLDAFGNLIYQFGIHEAHRELAVRAVSTVDVQTRPLAFDPTPWERVVESIPRLDSDLAVEVGFMSASSTFVDLAEQGTALRSIAYRSFAPGRGITDAVIALCTDIYETFTFDSGFSDLSTPLGDVLAARRGVCQDFAHLAIGCLRSIGLAARYISGYIETVPPAGQPRLVGADASHAWCSVWTPEASWVDLDPTNGHLPTNQHITVAWGRDYADVTPVRGVMIGPATEQSLNVSVDVAAI